MAKGGNNVYCLCGVVRQRYAEINVYGARCPGTGSVVGANQDGKVSENVRLASPSAGEQREVGEAREDVFGVRAEGPCLVGDLKCDGFVGDMATELVDWSDRTKSPSDVSP